MIELFVESIRVNMKNYKRVVMLKEKNAPRYLPIWIGHFEADAIAIPMQNVPVTRPLTHDLLVAGLSQVGWRWKYALIRELTNDTFYASLIVEREDREVELDCRPSDAISVAIRAKIPIYAADDVIERAGMNLDAETDKDSTTEQPTADAAAAPAGEPSRRSGPTQHRQDDLSPEAQAVLDRAQQAARSFNHNYIGTEHLLLGLLEAPDEPPARLLSAAGLTVEQTRAAVERLIGRGDRDVSGELGLTERARKVLQLARAAAQRLRPTVLASGDLLLGLLDEGEGIGAGILQAAKIDLVALQAQLETELQRPLS